jgi:predicted dehydrogenase
VPVAEADPYTEQLRHFAECLRQGRPSPVVSPESAVRALAVALRAREALDRGRDPEG